MNLFYKINDRLIVDLCKLDFLLIQHLNGLSRIIFGYSSECVTVRFSEKEQAQNVFNVMFNAMGAEGIIHTDLKCKSEEKDKE